MDATLGEDLTTKKSFSYPLKALTKHFVALGGSGSGKTVLSKILIEEAALKGIPSIVVDPQGDLAGLALAEDRKFEKVNVTVFTPTSSKGVPLSINPLKLPPRGIEYEDLVSILNQIASSIVALLGYDVNKDRGKHAQAMLYYTLLYCHEHKKHLSDFNDLISLLSDIPQSLYDESKGFLDEKKQLNELLKKLKFLTVGEKELLFNFGAPLDIDTLLGKKTKQTQVSVIYLQSLSTKRDKEFFLSMLALQLYEWMLKNPSRTLQALFFIDEIADYLPAGSVKPITKEILRRIYKQARKYGVGCIAATQNPGDIDYKSFAQFGTWAIGRLTTKQDRAKVKTALSSFEADTVTDITKKLPALKPGQFVLFCPDYFDDVQKIKTRTLYTQHTTLTLDAIKPLMAAQQKPMKRASKSAQPKATPKETSYEHWPVKVSLLQLSKIIEKNQKKLFILFGPVQEEHVDTHLIVQPMYELHIRVERKNLIGRTKLDEHTVYIDAEEGCILSCGPRRHTLFEPPKSLFNLKENELAVLSEVTRKKGTAEALAEDSGFTKKIAKTTLTTLNKKRLVRAAGKDEKEYIWESKVAFPTDVTKLASTDQDFTQDFIEASVAREKIKLADLKQFVKGWLSAKIIDTRKVYYPVYKVIYKKKGRQRAVWVSAVTGDVFSSQ